MYKFAFLNRNLKLAGAHFGVYSNRMRSLSFSCLKPDVLTLTKQLINQQTCNKENTSFCTIKFKECLKNACIIIFINYPFFLLLQKK